MTNTDRFGWDLPTPGASTGTWGQTLNDTIDDEIENHTWISKTVSSSYTPDNYEFVLADASLSGFQITLPSPPSDGFLVGVKKIDISNSPVVIDTNGLADIDDRNVIEIENPKHAITMIGGRNDYHVIGFSDARL